jgi:signal transduction histidine kinase/DNA-binding response OmpR family regulator
LPIIFEHMRKFFFLLTFMLYHFYMAGQNLCSLPNRNEHKIQAFEGYSCWDVQESNGLIYVATTGGILAYNGNAVWPINKPSRTLLPIIRSLTLSDNKIYFSSLKRDGYFRIDGDSARLFEFEPVKGHEYSSLNKLIASKGRIFFLTDSTLRILQNGTLSNIPTPGKQTSAIVDHELLYSYQVGIGLMSYHNKWEKVAGEISGESKTVLLASISNRIVAITENRMYELDQYKKQWNVASADYSNSLNGQATSVSLLGNNQIVIGSDKGEIILLKKSCSEVVKILLTNSSRIRTLYIDKQENLWVAHTKGLSLFKFDHPFFTPDSLNKKIFNSAVYSMAENRRALYIGGSAGLFEVKDLASNSGVRKLPFSNSNSNHDAEIQAHDNDLFLINNREGIFHYDEEKKELKEVYRGVSWGLIEVPFDNKKLLLHLGDKGIALLTNAKGRWEYQHLIKGLNAISTSELIWDNDNSLWFVDRENKNLTHRIRLDNAVKKVISDETFSDAEGLPISSLPYLLTRIFRIDNQILISTPNGVFSFVPERKIFYKNETLTELIGKKRISSIFKDGLNNIWLQPSEGVAFVLLRQKAGSYKKMEIPLSKEQRQILSVCSVDSVAFLGTNQGIAEVSLKELDKTFIEVKILSASSATLDESSITRHTVGGHLLQLPFTNNSIQFQFASSNYIQSENVQYQYRLKGLLINWSEWTKKSEKTFSNLPESNYKFELRAKDPFGKVSAIKVFSFKIFPPWYRTWWSLSAYFIVGLLLILGIVRWRTHAAAVRNKELEIIVKERTEQILIQKTTIETQAKELAEIADLKARFLTETAHELRTPLTLTLAPIYQLLDGKEVLPEDICTQLKLAERNGAKLLHLIEEIITVARLEKAILPITTSHGFPNAILKDLIECFGSFIRDKQITVHLNLLTADDLCLELDWVKYRKIVSNLLHNAIKFTPSSGEILLSCLVEEDPSMNSIVFETSIADTGEGIEEKDLVKIFDRFYQSEPDPGEGFGVGLSLVKDLINVMNGNIEVSSEPRKGTLFTFRLHSKTVLVNDEPNRIVSENQPNKPKLNYTQIILPEEERKPVLLIVEDNTEMRNYLRSILQGHFIIFDEGSGPNALRWLAFNEADIIISDWMMPGMDGIELYAKYKELEKNKLTPFILLTAKANHESRMEALTLGVDEYIQKPFSPRELMIRVERLLSRRKVRAEEKMATPENDEDYSLDEQFLQRFKKYVEDHISEASVKITDLCDVLAVSERTLHYKVKALTGITPASLIREIKLHYVRRLLEKRKIGSVSEAAYSIGFINVNHFSKLYEQQFGKKPSSYFKEQVV